MAAACSKKFTIKKTALWELKEKNKQELPDLGLLCLQNHLRVSLLGKGLTKFMSVKLRIFTYSSI